MAQFSSVLYKAEIDPDFTTRPDPTRPGQWTNDWTCYLHNAGSAHNARVLLSWASILLGMGPIRYEAPNNSW